MGNADNEDPTLVAEVTKRVLQGKIIVDSIGPHIGEEGAWRQSNSGAPALLYKAPRLTANGPSAEAYSVLIGHVIGPLTQLKKKPYNVSHADGRSLNLPRPLADVDATHPTSNTAGLLAAPGAQGEAISCSCPDFNARLHSAAIFGCKHMHAVNEKRRRENLLLMGSAPQRPAPLPAAQVVAPAQTPAALATTKDTASLLQSRKRSQAQTEQVSQGAAQRLKQDHTVLVQETPPSCTRSTQPSNSGVVLIQVGKEMEPLPVPVHGIALGRNKTCGIKNAEISRSQVVIEAHGDHVQAMNTSRVVVKVRCSPTESWAPLSPGVSADVFNGGSVALEMDGPDVYNIVISRPSFVPGSGAIPEENKTPDATVTDSSDAGAGIAPGVNTELFVSSEESLELFGSYCSNSSSPLIQCPSTGDSSYDNGSFGVQCRPPSSFIDEEQESAPVNKPAPSDNESPAPSDNESLQLGDYPDDHGADGESFELDAPSYEEPPNLVDQPQSPSHNSVAALDQTDAAAKMIASAPDGSGSRQDAQDSQADSDISCTEFMAARASQRNHFGPDDKLAIKRMGAKHRGKLKARCEERPYFGAMIDTGRNALFGGWCPNCGGRGHVSRNSPDCSIDAALALEEWRHVGIAWREMNPGASFKPRLCNFPEVEWGVACSCAKCT